MRVVILVMSCAEGYYPELCQKQRETWDSINHPDTETIFYYAGHTTELLNDRLMIESREGHGYFYIKTMLAFKFLLEMEWDYIFKTDNSAYVFKDQLVKVLKDKPRSKYYGGHLYQTTYMKTDPFLWGEGVALSRDVVKYLVDDYESSKMLRSGVEDVHIGMILNGKFPWDTSMTIQEFYKQPTIVPGHVYRCKNDDSKQELDDQIIAMQKLHEIFQCEGTADDKKSTL